MQATTPMRTYIIVLLHKLYDVRGIVGQFSHHRAFDEGPQLVVLCNLVGCDGKNDVDVLALDLVRNLTDGRVILQDNTQ